MKHFIVLVVYVLIFATIINGCAPSSVNNESFLKASIMNLEIQFCEAGRAKDVEKLMNLFSSDVVSMHPGAPAIVGKEAVKEWLEKIMSDTTYYLFETYSGTIDDLKISSSGDMAYGRGTDWVKIKTEDSIKIIDGKWIDIWKKVDGEWKCSLIFGDVNW